MPNTTQGAGAEMQGQKQRIDVSPEMIAWLGEGALPTADGPADPILFCFAGFEEGGTPSLSCLPAMRAAEVEDATLIFVVARAACRRIFEVLPVGEGPWILPGELRALVAAIRGCTAPGLARTTLQVAKCIETLCAVFDHLRRDSLVPLAGGALSELDAARITAARRLIDDRWHEKLTLDGIARACGLNRSKLARGFRAMFDCSVADALTQQRLAGARRMLQQTDLPIKAIGYRCGYLNNAAFTRAFSRHCGVAPTRFRAGGLAA